jgi:hypothetical protein
MRWNEDFGFALALLSNYSNLLSLDKDKRTSLFGRSASDAENGFNGIDTKKFNLDRMLIGVSKYTLNQVKNWCSIGTYFMFSLGLWLDFIK